MKFLFEDGKASIWLETWSGKDNWRDAVVDLLFLE